LNLNRKHSHDRRDHAFQLLRHHLASGKATDAFYRDLEDIDPDWRGHQASNATEVLRDKGGNEIPIWPDYIENPMNTIEEIENYVNRTRSPEEETLQEIMDRIFR